MSIVAVLRDAAGLLGRRAGILFGLAFVGTLPWIAFSMSLEYWNWNSFSPMQDWDPAAEPSVWDEIFPTLYTLGFEFFAALCFQGAQALVVVAACRLLQGAWAGRVSSILQAVLALSLIKVILVWVVVTVHDYFTHEVYGWFVSVWILGGPARPLSFVVYLLMTPFWVVIPGAVAEGVSGVRRSWRLTRGHRLKIFVILILLDIAGWIGIELYGLAPPLPRLGVILAWWSIESVTVAVTAVVIAVGYDALRGEQPVNEEELDGVFG